MDREAAGRNEAPGIWPIRPENERGQQSAAAHVNSRGRSGHAVHGRRLFRVPRYTRRSAMCTDRFVFTRRTVRNGSRVVKLLMRKLWTERSSWHQGEFVKALI
jgi:hypothetical protein